MHFCGTTPCNVSLSFVKDRSVVLNEDCGDSEVNCKPYSHMERSAHFRLECRVTGPQMASNCLRLLLVWRLTTLIFRRKICGSLTHKLLYNSFHQIVSSKLGLLLLNYSVHFAHLVNDEAETALCLIAQLTCKTCGLSEVTFLRIINPDTEQNYPGLYSASAWFKPGLERPFWWLSSVL